ncbi:SUZ RNA-binding domain-containing-like [Brevipalpus obovatus]|uniref:SUZ RNA-binding domain-containing-like n=1 Tax=Brevipalpus obovatus TaxID=246614 RepID=UPI003D9DB9ED
MSNIPSNPRIGPQITLEDNTRTQYVPQVKILKRPKGLSDGAKSGQDGDKNSSPGKSQSSGNPNMTKSLQEREAEYAKVRLRILGSATPNYQGVDSTNSSPSVQPDFL